MNRDEKRARQEEKNIKIKDDLCFPVDVPSQGTWIGMNEQGLVGALLNRYQDKHNLNASTSRGTIIPEFMQCKTIECVEKKIEDTSFDMFNPFDLLAINTKEFIQASWNGSSLNVTKNNIDKPFFISSSSERIDEILAYRHGIFKKFIQQDEIQISDILLDLHTSQEAGREKDAIFVEREATHTKSIVQITIEKNQSEMLYWTEDVLKNKESLSPRHAIQHSLFHFIRSDVA